MSNLDKLTLGEIKELRALFGSSGEVGCSCPNGNIKIAILNRAWVVVGKVYKTGSEYKIKDGYIVRTWGTTAGLGEIALNGPTSSTKLDKTSTVSVHELAVVAFMDCEQSKWEKLCK